MNPYNIRCLDSGKWAYQSMAPFQTPSVGWQGVPGIPTTPVVTCKDSY